MASDLKRSLLRTAWKQRGNLGRHSRLQFKIILGAPERVALAASGPQLGISKALGFGLIERRLLHEEALALIAPARAAEAHRDRAKPTRSLGAPGQRRIAGGQEHEMIHVGARQAQRSSVVHGQERAGRAARGTAPVLERHHYDELSSLPPACGLRVALACLSTARRAHLRIAVSAHRVGKVRSPAQAAQPDTPGTGVSSFDQSGGGAAEGERQQNSGGWPPPRASALLSTTPFPTPNGPTPCAACPPQPNFPTVPRWSGSFSQLSPSCPEGGRSARAMPRIVRPSRDTLGTRFRGTSSGQRKTLAVAGLLQSPLSDSNRRPLPYHGRVRVSRGFTGAPKRALTPCNSHNVACTAVAADLRSLWI